ncbi:hypothetical protein Tco_1429266 [Tanacetum coccineum]
MSTFPTKGMRSIISMVSISLEDDPVPFHFAADVINVAAVPYAFHQDKASSVKVPVANVTLFSSAHLLRENTDSVLSRFHYRSSSKIVFLLLELHHLPWQQSGASRAEVKITIIAEWHRKVMAGVSMLTGYGMIHEDGDNDAMVGNDDDRAIRVPVRLLGLLVLAMAAVCASTAVVRSAISCRMASKVMAGVSNV